MPFLLEEMYVLSHCSSITLDTMGKTEEILSGGIWISERSYAFN